MDINIGAKGIATSVVTEKYTAAAVGSGSLNVYATPCMAALMEQAACNAIAEFIPEDKTSVGIALSLTHSAATPVGLTVTAEAEVTAADGKTVSFQITAFDEKGKIGEATHTRAVVTQQRFMEKVSAKLL